MKASVLESISCIESYDLKDGKQTNPTQENSKTLAIQMWNSTDLLDKGMQLRYVSTIEA